ncbi:MAG: hypothetical protein IPN95_19590 [Bacteroidetes bacterium]|nr:hypothetical protein [Bacteroidota bacterium]
MVKPYSKGGPSVLGFMTTSGAQALVLVRPKTCVSLSSRKRSWYLPEPFRPGIAARFFQGEDQLPTGSSGLKPTASERRPTSKPEDGVPKLARGKRLIFLGVGAFSVDNGG